MSSLNAQQIASLLQQQGFSKEKIPTMTAIAMAESGGRPQAFNPVGLDKSYGLFQVNMHGGLGPARMKEFGLKSEKELFDPQTNVKAAKRILGSQGLGAWSVYNSGKYKEFLPQAQQALKGLPSQPGQPGQAPKPQQPQQTATAQTPGGITYNIYVDESYQPMQRDPMDFLQKIIQKPEGQRYSPAEVATALTSAIANTPNYDFGLNPWRQ